MESQTKILKWARQLCSAMPLVGSHTRRVACQKLASDKTAQAVPFLVSALAGSDEQVRRIAEDGLTSLSDPNAIDPVLEMDLRTPLPAGIHSIDLGQYGHCRS